MPKRSVPQQREARKKEEQSQAALRELSRRLTEESMGERPFYIRSVSVRGNSATRLDVIERELAAALEAETFQDVLSALAEAEARLACMDLFESIDIYCDVAMGDRGRAQATDITITVEERNRLTARTGTTVDVNDGNVIASAILRNVWGGGERIEVDWSTGTRVTSYYRAAYIKPNLSNLGEESSFSVFKNNTDYSVVSSHNQQEQGFSLQYAFPTPYFDHILGYTGVWREVWALPSTASFAVRSHAGHSVKSAFTHVARMERRDDPVLPRSGYALELAQEFAGLGGDAAFVKHEAKAAASAMLGRGWSITGLVAGGLVLPLTAAPLSAVDAFYLGGSMDVRGFRTFGIGPHAPRKITPRTALPLAAQDTVHTDAIGGDVYWKAAVHLYKRLHSTWGIYAQTFVNAGSLLSTSGSPGAAGDGTSLSTSASRALRPSDLISSTRVAIGAGLAFRTAIGLIELNYTYPIRFFAGDRTRSGLQFGIGLQVF